MACGSWPAVRGHRLDVDIFTERSCDNIAMDIYTKLLWIVFNGMFIRVIILTVWFCVNIGLVIRNYLGTKLVEWLL